MDSEIPKKLPRFHTVFPPKDQGDQLYQEKFPTSSVGTPPGGHPTNMVYQPPDGSDSQPPLLGSSVMYPERPLLPAEQSNHTDQPAYNPLLNNGSDMYGQYNNAHGQQTAPVTDTYGGEFNVTAPDVKPFSQTPTGDGWQFPSGAGPTTNPVYQDHPQPQQQLSVPQTYQQRAPLPHNNQYPPEHAGHMTAPPNTMNEEQLDPHQLSEDFMKDMCAWIKREHDSQQLSTFNMNIRPEDGSAANQPSVSTSGVHTNISQVEHPNSHPTESQSPGYSFSSTPSAGGSPWYFPQSQMSSPPGVLDTPNTHQPFQNCENISATNGKTMNYGHPGLAFPKLEEESRTACSNMPNMSHCAPYGNMGFNANFMNSMNSYVPTELHPMGNHQYMGSEPYYRPIKTEPGYCYMGPNDKNLRNDSMYNGMVPSSYNMNNYNTNQHRPIYSNASVKLEAKSKEPSDVYEFYDDCPSPTVHFGARHRLNKFPNGRIYGCNQKNINGDPKVLSYVSCDPADDLALTSGPEFTSTANQFLIIEQNLCDALSKLSFSEPVTNIYNPLSYAAETHRDFVMKFCKSNKDVLFLGMNPGPFGMAQNGIPFGEATIVREWLKIEGVVHKPSNEHPRRQVSGLQNTRKEVSGARFWGFFQRICETPERFFQHCFVHNMCPLVFLAKSGKNVTPPQMAVAQRRPLNKVCDHAFVDVVRLLGVKVVVGIGKFAQERASDALRDASMSGIRVECIMHPSPANPAANKGWESIVEKQLQDIDVMKYFQTEKREEGSS